MQQIKNFFSYAVERHAIYLRRHMGIPKSDLTEDPILQTYRFCNVFRELDTTTIWFRENVRDPLRDKPEVLLATVLFRWFNRIQTGEAIFAQGFLDDGRSAWDHALSENTLDRVKESILLMCGKGPYVTGSYIIKTPDGKNKLEGVLWCVEQFMSRVHVPLDRDGGTQGNNNWLVAAKQMLEWRDEMPKRMETVWDWLRQFPFLGDFMAYEIVTDLQYTALLDQAPDIMTWANPGPGAMRGLNRIHGRDINKKLRKEVYIQEMRDLLRVSQKKFFWPQWNGQAYELTSEPPSDVDLWQPDSWPSWDMRTVEHTLCEFDKMERVRRGEGKPKQRFR